MRYRIFAPIRTHRFLTGFTLIELLVVVAIIGLISSVALVYFSKIRAKARDIQRITRIKEIQKGLELYYDRYERYPNGENDEGGWDVGNPGREADDTFIKPLEDEGFFSKVPIDVSDKFNDDKYFRYLRYTAAPATCDGKAFYVLGAKLERSQNKYGISDEINSCNTYCDSIFTGGDCWWVSEDIYAIMEIEE